MRDEHIIDLLDREPLASLSEGEAARVRSHAEGCSRCRSAYDAARLSAALLTERVAEAVEPSPFFATRVTAALREQRSEAEENALARLWRAAGALVAAMAALVVLLAGAEYATYVPEPQGPPPDVAAAQTIYSPDWEVLGAADGQAQISDDQLISIMYDDSEDLYGQGR